MKIKLLTAILAGLLMFAGSYLIYRGTVGYLAGPQVPEWADSDAWEVAGVSPAMCPGFRLVMRTAYTDGTDGGMIYSDANGDFLWLFFKGKREPMWALAKENGKLVWYRFKALMEKYPSPCDVPRPSGTGQPPPGSLGNI